MAIDIVGDAIRDLLDKLGSSEVNLSVPDYAMRVNMESIKNLTSQEKNTRGDYFAPLSDTEPYLYATWKRRRTDEPAIANLRSGVEYEGPGWEAYANEEPQSKPKALDTMYNQVYDKESVLNFYSIYAHEYMGRHQEGEGVPKRKWFPTEEDSESTVQKLNTELIERYLLQILDRGVIVRSV